MFFLNPFAEMEQILFPSVDKETRQRHTESKDGLGEHLSEGRLASCIIL
jgi:hypothetical protein